MTVLMKTMRSVRLIFAFLFCLGVYHSLSRATQVSLDLPLTTPRLLSITSAPTGDLPAIDLHFRYDTKGKVLCDTNSSIDTNAVSGQGTLIRKKTGPISFMVTARGITAKTVSVVLHGQLGSNVASCTFQNGKKRVSLTNLAVQVSFVQPVTARVTLNSQ